MAGRDYWERFTPGSARVSRRAMLRGAGVAGIGLAGAALIGCGDDDDDDVAAPAPAAPAATAAPAAADDPFPGVKRGGELVLTLTGDPPTIDPYGNNSFLTKGFAAYHYSRLFKLGTGPNISAGGAVPVPDLAESAETADGLRWVMKLKKGVKFHNLPPVDGRELTTEDIRFSYDLATSDKNLLREGLTNDIDGLEVIDDYTFAFNLKNPISTFLDVMSDGNLLWIMPFESEGAGRNAFDPKLESIGTGPWILDQYRPSVAIQRSKNPDYFIEGIPFVDGMKHVITPEYATRLAQFQAGNTTAFGSSGNDVLALRSQNPDLQWRGNVPQLVSMLYFSDQNVPDGALWKDDRFRIAVSMSVDRNGVTDLAYNTSELKAAGLDVSEAWNNYVPAGMTRWWLDPQSADHGASGKNFNYDVAEASKMIAAIPGATDEVTYQYTANRYGSTFNKVAEANIGFMQDIGLDIKVQVQDYSSVYITNTSNGVFDGIAFGYETPFPEVSPYMSRAFGVDEQGEPQLKNRGRIIDQDIIEITKKQAVEVDPEARRELIWEFQRINATHMYYVPNQAGAGTNFTAYQPNVRGIRQTRGYGAGVETVAHLWLDS